MQKLTMQPMTKELSLQAVFDKFIAFKKIKNLSVETIQYYEECFKFFTGYFPADQPCTDITKDICLGYIQHLRDTRPDLKGTTVNAYLRGIRAMLYYAMEQEYLPRFKVELIKAEKEIKETYSDDELARLLKKPSIKQCNFTEYRNWVLVNYLLATGNRLGTVVNLRIRDINFHDGVIVLTKTKNRQQQIIPMSQTLVKILQEYLQYRQGEPEDYLFCNQFGKQFTKDGLKCTMKKYNYSRDVEKTSLHLFRHTFAKKWIMSGGDIFRLQKLLGHSSLDVVKEYVNIFGADLKEQFDHFNPLENVYRSQNLESKTALSMKRK